MWNQSNKGTDEERANARHYSFFRDRLGTRLGVAAQDYF